MSIVVKFSKPTFDVLTASNKNLSFSSELATHAIYSKIDVSFISGTEFTINHNLGYVPKVWVYWDGGNFLWRIPIITAGSSGYDYSISSTQVIIHRDGPFAWPDFKVVIFTRSPNP